MRLNQRIRTDADARLVDAATWNSGAVPVVEPNLIGKMCIAGFDMPASMISRACPRLPRAPTGALTFSAGSGRRWGSSLAAARLSANCFEQWLRRDWLICVPGEIIDPAWMPREIRALARGFKFREIRYDRSYMASIKLAMAKAGITLPFVEFQQGLYLDGSGA